MSYYWKEIRLELQVGKGLSDVEVKGENVVNVAYTWTDVDSFYISQMCFAAAQLPCLYQTDGMLIIIFMHNQDGIKRF